MAESIKVDVLPWEKSLQPKPVDRLPWLPNKGVDITRQRKGVVTGDEYGPGGMSNPKNKQIFETTGEPFTIFGVPVLDMRVQKTTNNEGEPRTKFVPKPSDLNTGTNVVDQEAVDSLTTDYPNMPEGFVNDLAATSAKRNEFNTTGIERMVGGGALETIKSTVDFGLWLLEKTGDITGPKDVQVDPTTGEADNAGLKEMRDKFNENFPTMPAANNVEKTVQEIIPVVVGYVTGREVGKTAIKELPEQGAQYIKYLSDFYIKARKVDPATANAKLQLLTRALVTELSGNAGATVGASEDTTSISQEGIFGLPGIVPEDIGGDKTAANKLGQFVDNNAFSAGLFGLAKLIGVPAKLIKDKFWSGSPASQQNIASAVIRTIDEDVTEQTPPEELARRIGILGDILQNNKQFDFAVNGTDFSIPVDATSAVLNGAREYARKVYTVEAMNLPPEMFDEWINSKAQTIVENMMSIKQALKANPVTATSDSNVLAGFGDAFNKIADDIAVGTLPSNRGSQPEVLTKTKDFFAKPVAEGLNTPIPTDLNTLAATAARDDEMNKNTLIQMFEEARRNNMLGSNAQERAALEKMTGDDLYNNYISDKEGVNDAFKNVPSIPVDPNELALVIQEAGDIKGFMDAAGLSPKEPNLVQAVGDVVTDPKTGKVIEDPLQELANLIEQRGFNDLTTIVRELRPMLARQRDVIKGSQSRINKNTEQIDSIINWIDQTAAEAGPEMDAAMDTFKRFSDKWKNTQPLRDFTEAADEVRTVNTTGADGLPVTTFEKGGPAMRDAGMKAFIESKEAFTDEQLVKFLNAMRSPTTNNKAMTQALVAQAINQLAAKNPSGVIKTTDIIGAVQPLLRTLEAAGDTESVKIFKDAAEKLQMTEANIGIASTKDEVARNAYNLILEKARRSAAFELVYPAESGFRPVSDSAASNAFKKIFDGPQSIDKVSELIAKAESSGNQLAVDGIRSELINWLNTKLFTKKTVGAKVLSDGELLGIRDASGAQLTAILEDQGNPVIPIIQEAFKTDPNTGKAIVQMMQMLHGFVNSRATKVNPFGSNTVNDGQLNRAVNLMITLTLGVLNPTATKARGIAGVVLQDSKANIKEAVEYMMSRMVTDPNFLKESLDMLAADKTGTSWKDRYLKGLGIATNAMTKGIIATERPSVEQQTEEAIPTQ